MRKLIKRLRFALLFVALAFLLLSNAAFAEKRVALVIGNSAYQNVSSLANPKNDAEAMIATLKRLEFEVISGLDVDHSTFIQKIRKFSRALRGAKVALFFYAGHGLQVDGANYLAPVETKLSDEEDLEFETVRLRTIMSQMEREPRTNLVFLDACRDNPLARNLVRSMGTRSASVGRGLASIETGVGTLIAFATQPGNVALDGDTQNSPFTESLIEHIETPGVDVAVLLRRVRLDVIEKTEGKQVPWSNSSLTGDVVLKAKPKPKPIEIVEPKPDNTLEITFWNSIKDGNEPGLFEAYLKRYPDGAFAELASIRLNAAILNQKEVLKPKAPDNSAEIAYWNTIKNTSGTVFYEAYLTRYPKGLYTEISKLKIAVAKESDRREASQIIQDVQNRDNLEAKSTKSETTKLALLELPKDVVNSPDSEPVTEVEPTKETAKSIQRELNRLGCSAGAADGIWGKGSRRALKQYVRYGKVKLASLEPSTTLLDQLKTKQTRICPLVCRSGFEKRNDKCVRTKREASIQAKEPPKQTNKKPIIADTAPKVKKKTARKKISCYVCTMNNRVCVDELTALRSGMNTRCKKL